MNGMSVADKNELLFQYGINFNDLPSWEKRGVGLYWQEYEKIGHNPITGENITTKRNQIKRDLNLPMKDEYSHFIAELISKK